LQTHNFIFTFVGTNEIPVFFTEYYTDLFKFFWTIPDDSDDAPSNDCGILHLLDTFKLDDVSHLSVFEARNIEFRTHFVSSGSTIIFYCAAEFVFLFSLFVG
jgi:hypothetical protein